MIMSQLCSTLATDVGQFTNKVVSVSHAADANDVFRSHIWVPKFNVFLDGSVEEDRFLLNDADSVAQPEKCFVAKFIVKA